MSDLNINHHVVGQRVLLKRYINHSKAVYDCGQIVNILKSGRFHVLPFEDSVVTYTFNNDRSPYGRHNFYKIIDINNTCEKLLDGAIKIYEFEH